MTDRDIPTDPLDILDHLRTCSALERIDMRGETLARAADEIEQLRLDKAQRAGNALAVLQAQHERDCVVETLMHAKALLVTAMAAGHEPLPWSWQQEAAAFVNGPAPDVPAEPSVPKVGDACPACSARLGTSQNQVRCANCGWLGTYTPNRG